MNKTTLSKPKAILFDWDNTLADTWPIIHEALHKTFIKMDLEPWTMDMVKERVSRSMRESFPDVFGEKWEIASEIYQKHYREIHLSKIAMLPGALEVVKNLKDRPVYVAVVSNKKAPNLRVEADHIGWKPYFHKVVGAGDASRDKPAPDMVHVALDGSGVKAGPDVWFIGDSEVDMECATRAGCVPIWYGELPKKKLSYPYQYRVADHNELAALIASVF